CLQGAKYNYIRNSYMHEILLITTNFYKQPPTFAKIAQIGINAGFYLSWKGKLKVEQSVLQRLH
ncbi:MAG: hypothetical protein K8F30_11030, partial [Taibaiella sp.]|nr:hypothetical protein [Taibaiella sp.]